MDLERVQQNTPLTLSHQWSEDGVAVDPGTVTVGITRADGTVLVAAGTGTGGATTAPRTFNLTTAHTALLDRLTVTWTSTLKGTLVSYVEVVGGFLFTIPDARRIKPLDSVSSFPTDSIVAMRTTVEDALEQACGVAFVPRYTLETRAASPIVPRWPYVQRIRSITADGVDYTQTQLDETAFSPLGGITLAAGWPGTGSIIIGYEHGHSYTPPEITRAALILTKMWLGAQNRPVDDRAITFNTTDGGTYSLAVPGRNGSEFGHPDVDVAVQRYGMRVGVA